MGNMSYCRYENTSKDLKDCVNALYQADVSEPLSSQWEVRGLRDLLELSKEIVDMEDIITEILDNQ
jgi:hypothetical protein